MDTYVECCGYTVTRALYDFLVENDFSVRVACAVCRRCASVQEAREMLEAVAKGELVVRNLGKRSTAEIVEKMKKYL